MVLRFSQMAIVADKIEKELKQQCAFFSSGNLMEYRKLRQQFHLLPNADLFIDDDMDPEYKGILLMLLRARCFRAENAEIIVPDKYNLVREPLDQPEEKTPEPEETPEPDNILDFLSLVPDEFFDDGRSEEEFEEFLRNPHDDDE